VLLTKSCLVINGQSASAPPVSPFHIDERGDGLDGIDRRQFEG
jgi:hypothetical protein